jgi:DNA (cytosine-5)-methyltransferase 1
MTDATTVPQELRHARRMYSQRELAGILHKSQRTICRWENGQTPVPPIAIYALRDILSRPQQAARLEQSFRFIDLFAGIGGVRLGFEAVGGHCVYTSEWDKWCHKTYLANFPGDAHQIGGDITTVEAADIPDHDVLLAGFPCQPFSIAGVSKKNALGRPHGFECTTQGTLFFDVARIIQAKRPAAFLLENVKNLVSHDRGNTFRVILETLRNELGYHVHWKVVDARHFVPQHRERILIVGFREDVPFDWSDLDMPSLDIAPRLRTILHSEDGAERDHDDGRFIDNDGAVQQKYVLSDGLWTYLQNYAEKHRAKGNGFGFGLVGPGDVSRTLSARYYKDGSEILVRRPVGNPRRLTPRECARLMGYPDTWKIPVSDTRAYKQFGNSVAVPVIEAVARLMRPSLAAILARETRERLQGALFE